MQICKMPPLRYLHLRCSNFITMSVPPVEEPHRITKPKPQPIITPPTRHVKRIFSVNGKYGLRYASKMLKKKDSHSAPNNVLTVNFHFKTNQLIISSGIFMHNSNALILTGVIMLMTFTNPVTPPVVMSAALMNA